MEQSEPGTIMEGQPMRTLRIFTVFLLLVCLMGLANPGRLMAFETANFIVRDLTGQLSNDQIRRLASGAEGKLRKILDFWDVDSRAKQLGKIRLEFAKPRGGTYSTVFLMMKEEDHKVRVVRIYGVSDEPEMVAHKLTHAVFPTADKLIRNMMGIPMEVRFGNPLTFPMCGSTHDEWVAVFRRNHSLISLSENISLLSSPILIRFVEPFLCVNCPTNRESIVTTLYHLFTCITVFPPVFIPFTKACSSFCF